MARTILIGTDGLVTEFQIHPRYLGDLTNVLQTLVDEGQYEVIRPDTLLEATTDLDGRAVLLVNRDHTLTANDGATALVFVHAARSQHWVAGDAYVIGETATGLTDLPERIGEGDIRDLIEYHGKR